VIGYYSPEQDELFVVSRTGSVGPTQRSTYAHEFTHQLQDQHFDLDSLGLDATDQGDRSLGRLALVEGDATTVQQAWMVEAFSAADFAQLAVEASDPAVLAAFAAAPAYLRETSLFPYQDGLSFVSSLIASGGEGAVDRAFSAPPASTEQILHPEKYAAREAPVPIAIPAGLVVQDTLGAGWSVVAQDTLGELVLRIWLRGGGLLGDAARTAAAGWGGDRVALVHGPDGDLDLVVTTWDSPADAAEFAIAAGQAALGLGLVARGDFLQSSSGSRVTLVIGAGAAAIGRVVALLAGP